MNVERTHMLLERRAAIHAALSDPARLAIVDALAFGDASPSELQHALEMPSNLIAFHTKALEAAGLIGRSRSEADKRRTYLHLVPGALDLLSVPNTRVAHRVVFVCTAASARSQLAASLWRRASDVPAVAAGTHPAERIAEGAIDLAHRHALPLQRLRPRHLDEVRQGEDFVITVCDRAHEELGDLPDLHWSVPDPVPANTDDAFDIALADLSRRVTDLAPRIRAS